TFKSCFIQLYECVEQQGSPDGMLFCNVCVLFCAYKFCVRVHAVVFVCVHCLCTVFVCLVLCLVYVSIFLSTASLYLVSGYSLCLGWGLAWALRRCWYLGLIGQAGAQGAEYSSTCEYG